VCMAFVSRVSCVSSLAVHGVCVKGSEDIVTCHFISLLPLFVSSLAVHGSYALWCVSFVSCVSSLAVHSNNARCLVCVCVCVCVRARARHLYRVCHVCHPRVHVDPEACTCHVPPVPAMCRLYLPCATRTRHVPPVPAMCRLYLPCAACTCHVLPVMTMCDGPSVGVHGGMGMGVGGMLQVVIVPLRSTQSAARGFLS
jgi:hypothetical protein